MMSLSELPWVLSGQGPSPRIFSPICRLKAAATAAAAAGDPSPAFLSWAVRESAKIQSIYDETMKFIRVRRAWLIDDVLFSGER